MNTSTNQHSVFSPELGDPLSHPETFADPPNEVRPKWRWWWTGSYFSTEEARREIEAMIDAGFSGAEITWDGGLWAKAEQREALQATLELAGKRDFEIDMTLAPAGRSPVRPRLRRRDCHSWNCSTAG